MEAAAHPERAPTPEEEFRAPNAVAEIKALLRRNTIERRRTKCTTFCELCSPVLLLCALVYGYFLSDVLVFPEEVYSSLRINLPGEWGRLLPLARFYSQDLTSATLPSRGSSSLADGGSAPDDNAEPVVSGDDDGGLGGLDGGETEDGLNFRDVRDLFQGMTMMLDGPCVVPDLDQFVGLGTAVAGDLGENAYGQVVNSMEAGWVFGNIITQGTLHFAPAGEPAVWDLVSWLSNTTSGFDALIHRVHESEDDAITYALDHLEERTWAIIALNEVVDGRVDYTIRMNFTVTPNTNTVVDMISIGLDPSFRSYYLSGFLTLQTTLDRFMFSRALPAASSEERSEEGSEETSSPGGFACVPPDVVGVPFPTAAYDQNLFYAAIGYLLGLAMTMSTMYPLSRLVKGIVEEKESRVRETMRIMGLRAWCHEVSWLLTGAAVFAFIAVTVAGLLSWTFLPLADGSLLMVYVIAFTLSEVGMALLVASVFSKAKLASIAAPCVLFAGVLPRYIFYGANRHEAPRSKTLASLLSPTAFTFGADFIADYEYAGIGAGWGNYDEGQYSLRTSITMMFLDAVLYGLLAWYLDKVVTPEYGTPHDPLKALTSLSKAVFRWLRRRLPTFHPNRGWNPIGQTEEDNRDDGQASAVDPAGVRLEEARPLGLGVGVEGGPADFEPMGEKEVGAGEGQGVVIKQLRKVFGKTVAVAGLDLRLRVGDITCLLGHNGAGKSTTISMLTGQLGATSGDAFVSGHSVRDNLHKVRRSIGICPQHDALMPLLTAREHLEMFMDIKGMRPELKGPLVTKMLREVGLLEKEHTPSMSLSGGQKRKLSVALALTGSPSLCILDEPTSGMDPYSRRFTWDLLRRGRAGRCTLLSTHFMEEADHLGDRVAILRRGKLRCAGSPLFLKNRFGLGYKLTLVRAGESFEPNSLTSLVLSHVEDAETLSAAGGEISFRLPREESQSFPGLFRALEAGREEMGVGGYGVSITSLEEVFLSLEKEGRLTDAPRISTTSGEPVFEGGGSMRRDGRGDATGAGLGRAPVGGSSGNGRGAGRDPSRGQGRNFGRGAIAAGDNDASEDTASGQVCEIEMQSMAAAAAAAAGVVSTAAAPSVTNTHEQPERSADGADADNRGAAAAAAEDSRDRNSNTTVGVYADLASHREDLTSILVEDHQDGIDVPSCKAETGREPVRRVGAAGADLWEQLRWLLWKRWVVAQRDWRGAGFQIILPVVLVALVLILLTIDVKLAGPPLTMSAGMFGGRTQVLYAEGEGGFPGPNPYANIARGTEAWTRVDGAMGLNAPTSSGLSRFMLDTYNTGGLTGLDAGAATPTTTALGDNEGRAPRYGAYVFGDRIPVNVTVDWDSFRRDPEILAYALEIVGEDFLPAAGGELDLQALLAATGFDKNDLTALILNGSGALDQASNEDPLYLQWVKGKNLTREWLDLVDEDPTVRYTHAEYLPESAELKLDGVVVSFRVNNVTQDFEYGEIKLSVDDILRNAPPGIISYDQGVLEPNRTLTTVMFNSTAPHALPAWVGELTALAFEACATQRGFEGGKISYTTRSHPLPLTATESLEVQTMLSVLVSLLVTIPLCYAPAAFVTFLVKERACKSKRVQLVSGASPLAYWVSTYLWDVLLFFVLTVLVMLAFAAYGRDASKVFMARWDAFLGTWGLLVSYGLSSLPLSYLYSFAFDGPSAAQISIAGINFLSGFGFVVAFAVLSSLKRTYEFAARAQHVFRLFPPYLLGDGLIRVSSEFYVREVMGMDRDWGAIAWDVAGKGICYMCLEAVAYLGLVLVVEYSHAAGVPAKADRLRLRLGGWSEKHLAEMLRNSRGAGEDRDVRDERNRVDRIMTAMTSAPGGGAGGVVGNRGGGLEEEEMDTVLIRGLTKVYPAPISSAQQSPKCAVRGLSLGVKRGECFGLLGINGAGKSTTLQILTRDLQATSGNITVEGNPITSSAVCRLLGYCPQTDPLLPLMTVNETLLFFGGLKGIGLEQPHAMGGGLDGALQRAATAAMSAVSLGATENQRAGTLSGGNMRKLSLAVALIGGPPVLLLDEPSSGMDPGARRSMWEVISSLSESRSIILTTHSMEECEAVCDRLGIMVSGRLRCIGTSQHLKGRFGGGYSIEVRCPTESMPQVTEMVLSLSSLARLDEMHPTLAKFSIPATREVEDRPVGSNGERVDGVGGMSTGGLSLSRAFETIESRKEQLQVWDYSISQATLETIFMSFARTQEEEVASVPGVRYTDTASDAMEHVYSGGDNNIDDTDRHGRSRPLRPMDVEMGRVRGRLSRFRELGSSSDVVFAEQEESAALV